MLDQKFFELSGLVHAKDDITPAYELAVDVYLRHSRPLGKLLDAAPELLVRQDVKGLHLLAGHAVQVEELHDGAREAALGQLGRAFHEQDERGGRHGGLDLVAGVLREGPGMEGRAESA